MENSLFVFFAKMLKQKIGHGKPRKTSFKLKFCLLPEVGGHILSRGEEQMPSPLVQSRSVDQQLPKNRWKKVKLNYT